MVKRAAPDELLRVAERISSDHPSVAALLREIACVEMTMHPRGLRKKVVRYLWKVHYPEHRRTAAARLIEVAWKSFQPGMSSAIPGTKEHLLDRLYRACIPPVAWRQIADDLDQDLDPR